MTEKINVSQTICDILRDHSIPITLDEIQDALAVRGINKDRQSLAGFLSSLRNQGRVTNGESEYKDGKAILTYTLDPKYQPKQEPEPKVIDEPIKFELATPDDDSIESVLAERGSRYGSFAGHAAVAQELKIVIASCLLERDKQLEADMQEALDMICHKIARIINGDPEYADSWIDIAGYAKLVADRLTK